jgi:hypothetical protein
VDGELSRFINSENVCLRVDDDGEDMEEDGRSEKTAKQKIY